MNRKFSVFDLRSQDPDSHADEVTEERVENDENGVGDVGGDREVGSELLLQLGRRRQLERRIRHHRVVQGRVPELKEMLTRKICLRTATMPVASKIINKIVLDYRLYNAIQPLNQKLKQT